MEAGCAEFALRVSRSYIREATPTGDATLAAASLDLCASLCRLYGTGGPGSIASETCVNTFVAGGGGALVTSALERLCSEGSSAIAAGVYSSCASMALPLVQAVLAHSRGGGVPDGDDSAPLRAEEEEVVAIVGTLMAVASSSSACVASSACMAPTLQLVNYLCRWVAPWRRCCCATCCLGVQRTVRGRVWEW